MPRLEPDDDQSMASIEKHNHRQNIIRYLFILLLSLIYVYFFGGYFPYMLFYLVLALPVMSLVHLVVICVFFRVSERLNERTFIKGEYAHYQLILQNSSFLYMPYITVRMKMEGKILCKNLKSMRLHLAPFSTREFEYRMPLLYRGRYDIGVKSIHISDLLGLFSFTIYPMEKKNILVKPRIVDLHYKVLPVTRITDGELTADHWEIGNEELVDIREYAYGDSFRKIHWKLSSKLSKTMVKEMRNALDSDAMVILNLQNPEKMDEATLLKEDCIIEEMLSLISFLIKANVNVRLCFYKDEPNILRANNALAFQELYNFLSEVKFNQNDNFNQGLKYFTDAAPGSTLVYLFTLNLDGELINTAMQVKSRGFEMELYYIQLLDVNDNESEACQALEDLLIKNHIRAFKLEPSLLKMEYCHYEAKEDAVKVEEKAYEV